MLQEYPRVTSGLRRNSIRAQFVMSPSFSEYELNADFVRRLSEELPPEKEIMVSIQYNNPEVYIISYSLTILHHLSNL